ncbi:hypothetical protein EX30DRAFT_340277 [Ascodesmis nigricans]|uniref:Uncharacterized protein n=1 Tax=Ascodesmis nigricans TaxID=341454 RepID=A0A4S2MYK4_9PEZI|nr:hypothetical protein EX30DRAFT_340277 [Ascodesmis nigricans]
MGRCRCVYSGKIIDEALTRRKKLKRTLPSIYDMYDRIFVVEWAELLDSEKCDSGILSGQFRATTTDEALMLVAVSNSVLVAVPWILWSSVEDGCHCRVQPAEIFTESNSAPMLLSST